MNDLVSDLPAGIAADVLEELRGDPRVDAERIIVSSDGRTINLNGIVRTYSERCRAEEIAREILGVEAVRNELEVRLGIGSCRTDRGLERLLREILQNHAGLRDPLPRVTVSASWLTLEGAVTSEAQRRAAENSLRDVAGIRGISNHIEVEAGPEAAGAGAALEAAVRRRARLSVHDLKIEVRGVTLTVSGRVGSCVEHDMLIELASRMRGISRIDDHVVVQPVLRSCNA